MRLLPAVLLALGLGTAHADALEPNARSCEIAAQGAHLVVQARAQGLDPISASALVVHRLASSDFPAQALWATAFLVYNQAPQETTPAQASSAVLQACLGQIAPTEANKAARRD